MPSQQGRHRCDYCSRAFSRNEHLQRHRLTHNSIRPFSCQTCFEAFARTDALKRHETRHSAESSSSGGDNTGNGRRLRGLDARVTFACDRCAKMKVRCNGNYPCVRCLAKGLPCNLEREHTALRRLCSAELALLPHPRAVNANMGSNEPGKDPAPGTELALNDAIEEVPTMQEPRVDPDNSAGLSPARPIYTWPAIYTLPLADRGQYGQENIMNQISFPSLLEANDETGTGQQFDSPRHDTGGIYTQGISSDFWDSKQLFFDQPGGPGLFPAFFKRETCIDNRMTMDTQDGNPESINMVSSNAALVNDRSPYDNYPMLHKPSGQGKALRISLIYDFLRDPKSWDDIAEIGLAADNGHSSMIPIISESIRDTIMASVHFVLAKALDKESLGQIPYTFPSLDVVRSFFASYFSRFSPFYPIVHPSAFDINSSRHYNGSGMQLQMLTVLIIGALFTLVSDGQGFAVDLAAIIHQVLHDILLKDAWQTGDVWLTSTSILITAFGMWSGNRLQVELAEALRGSYTTMMSRRGLHERTQVKKLIIKPINLEETWLIWAKEEKKRRLAYVWYMVEQEITLFNGVPSTLSFSDMRSPMPNSEDLFLAQTAEAWRELVATKYGESNDEIFQHDVELKHPLSLSTFHNMFIQDNSFQFRQDVTAIHLRLLLCTIQTLVFQYSQTVRFVPDEEIGSQNLPNLPTGNGNSVAREEELTYLLARWYLPRRRVVLSDTVSQNLHTASTLIFHLVAMELYICYEDVQLLVGKEGLGESRLLLPSFQRWASSPRAARALSHAGQVLRIMKSLGSEVARPCWWPLAVSRAALVLWSYGIVVSLRPPKDHVLTESQPYYFESIDNDADAEGAMFGTPRLRLVEQGCMPCLSNQDETLVPIIQITNILDICLKMLEDG